MADGPPPQSSNIGKVSADKDNNVDHSTIEWKIPQSLRVRKEIEERMPCTYAQRMMVLHY